LEAAHIKWHEAKGPAEVENGLALCTLHHDLFDRGAFTVLPGLNVLVANDVDGEGVEQSLLRFDGERLRAGPQRGYPVPAPRFLAWHQSEVFRSPT
ncbi:MAG: HNH endonuclease, partial [Gammaproteobacteria bacterium]|nr:HNH endonuclease [Gammaproteobacteria bacterium]